MTRAPLLLALALGACAPHQPAGAAPKPRAVQLALADALVDSGNPDAALQLLSRTEAAEGGGPDLDLIKARALRDTGLTTEAEARLRALVQAHPRRAEAWEQLGILLLDRHDPQAAVDAFSEATRRAPKNSVYLNNLGFSQLVDGRAADAVQTLTAALALDGGSARVRLNLGFALAAAGQPDAALEVFRATGSAAEAQYRLGVALELWSTSPDAARAYAAALALDPGHAGAAAALARLGASATPQEPP